VGIVMCGFCNVCVFVCLDFIMCVCVFVFVGFVMCVFFNEWMCFYLGFVMCECVYVLVL